MPQSTFPAILTAILLLLQQCTTTLASTLSLPTTPLDDESMHILTTRQAFEDSFKIYNRKRNAHACIMSITFLVLLPLGAISLRLPLSPYIKRFVSRLHAPIQLLGVCMMIGAAGLGIDLARNDLHYFSPVKAHVALGLLIVSVLVLVQPALGVVQHVYYGRKGQKSLFGHVHRWTGRSAIVAGWVNSWLGFKLYGWELVKHDSIVRNALVMGALGAIWFTLVGVDGWRRHVLGKEGLRGWQWKGKGRKGEKADGKGEEGVLLESGGA